MLMLMTSGPATLALVLVGDLGVRRLGSVVALRPGRPLAPSRSFFMGDGRVSEWFGPRHSLPPYGVRSSVDKGVWRGGGFFRSGRDPVGKACLAGGMRAR